MSSRLVLTIEARNKDIPYPAATNQDSQNYGFKPLKGKPEKAGRIQEAKGFPGMISTIQAINAKGSPFFSIGCEKYIGPENFGGYYARGYIEFAYNYAKMVNFAQTADLFRMFSEYCPWQAIPESTTFIFELQPAHFVKAKVDGYSCCVWTRTGGHASLAEAERAYNKAVRHLGHFVDTIGPPKDEPDRIY